jgi:hypothetical protein
MEELVKKTVSFEGRANVSEITNTKTGEVSYLTPATSFKSLCREAGATDIAVDEEHHVLALFNGSERVHTLYMCRKIQDFDNTGVLNNIQDLKVFESWNSNSGDWVPCLTLMKDKLEDKKTSLTGLL